MDRFAVQLSLGYLSTEAEIDIISHHLDRRSSEGLQPCLTVADILTLKQQVQQVRVSAEVRRYAVEIVEATRRAEGVQLGASPRGSIALVKVAQALALFDGYEFVLPDYIRDIAPAVLAHRLVMEPQARFSGRTAATVVAEILRDVLPPA
jgi:MoxR-like ATPase